MIVAQALEEAEVADVAGTRIALRALSANPLVPETVSGKRAIIEAAARQVFGAAGQVVLHRDTSAPGEPPAAPPAPPAPDAAAPHRLTVSGARAERTRSFRGRDPALDSAMDALDLELLE